jgi:uncharacterized protein YbcI
MTASSASEHAANGSSAAAISNLVVGLMSEYTGRGPTRARTYVDRDLVSVVLADTLTKGERSLIRDGETMRVLDMRKAFQRTMREDLVSGVERITGRKVIAFLSDNHVDPDIAVESFVLAPVEADTVPDGAHKEPAGRPA